jgi:putative tRNA adenosine deaminase-associated protein
MRGESVLAVAYFAALLARSADRWTARDADLDEIEDVAGLVEFMREGPQDDEEEDEPDTTVLLLEQEDVWFAVVRLDAEEDPRLFVSDVAAVSRSAYADLLLSGDLVPVGPDGRPAEEVAAVAEEDAGDPVDGPGLADLDSAGPAGRRPRHSGPAGDAELLADFGVRAAKLVELCGGGLPPAEALADLAEALGAADELEEVR